MSQEEFQDISGSKKGGGSKFYEEDNTLQSTATVQVLEVISAGPIKGLVGGGKGIYLNNTPLENADGTKNFGGKVAWDQRTGIPDQPYMEGFPSASSEVPVNVQVTTSVSATYTVSSPDIDFVYVTVGLPEGLSNNNTSNNRLEGSEVELRISRRLGAGAWSTIKQFKISGKTTSAYEESHHIPRPTGTGTWSIRLERITADSTAATLRNATWLNRVTENIDARLTYDDIAYVGVAVDAATVSSSQVPVRSYLADGRIIKVPANYNPTTRAYTGVWNGTFKFEFTDNPAWVIYDLLADPINGLGIDESLIDKYSFYNAAVYNDQTVNIYRDNVVIGTEPRFRFNYQMLARQDVNKWVQDIAATMNAKVIWMGGKATVQQDRPRPVTRLITTSNVIDGDFNYVSSPKQERVTAVNVTWNDPGNFYQQSVVQIDKSSTYGNMRGALHLATERYGYESLDIVALGCTSEGQARRAGLWKLDTVLNQTEAVRFKMFLNGYDLAVGDIVEIFDENYAGAQQAGRIISGSTTTSIKLDRAVTLTAGSTISIQLPNGNLETKNIVQTSGSLSTITVSSAFSTAPTEYNDFIVTTTLSPRQFRLTKTSLEEEGIVNVEAVFHDPAKYTRIENGVNVPAPVYSDTLDYQISVPTGILFREVQVNEDNTVTRTLNVSWVRPVTGAIIKYIFKWQYNKGGWSTIETAAPSADIRNALPGSYEFRIYAIGYNNTVGPEATASYSISTAGGSTSTLNPVTNLVTVEGTGTTFTGRTLNVVWTNPSTNAAVTSATIRDFRVDVLTTGDVLLRTEYIPPVQPGNTQKYTYTYDTNLADGGPRRSVKIRVRIRDGSNNLSNDTTVTFSNTAPAAPASVVPVGGLGAIFLDWDQGTSPDYQGSLVWMSTTNGFTPSASNLVFEGNAGFAAVTGLTDGTMYYIRVANYDDFGKDYNGTGLNLSGQISVSTAAGAGIPSGPTLPVSGTEGDLFFLTTDDKLYRYTGSAWTAAVDTSDLVGQITNGQLSDQAVSITKFANGIKPVEIVATLPTTGNVEGRMVYLTTDDKLYRYTGSAWTAAVATSDLTGQILQAQIADAAINTAKFAAGIEPVTIVSSVPGTLSTRSIFNTTDGKLYRWNGSAYVASVASTDISGTISDAQIAAVAAAKVTGTLTDSQLAAISAAKVTGQITGTQITDGAISTAKIAAGAITSNEIAANTITAADIAAGTITGTEIAAGTITGAKIAAGTIAASNIVSGTITSTQIAASTITGANIAADTITAGNIAAGAISTSELAAGAVTAAKIAAGTITANEIAAQTITGNEIAANTITGNKIAADTIVAANIAAGAIGTSELTSGAVTTANLAAGAVTAAKIAAGTITSYEIAANTITGDKLVAGTITSSQIATGTIVASNIAGSTITGSKIAASTITSDKMNVSTLSSISSNAGIVVSGQLQNSTASTVLNLNATGSSTILRSGPYNYYGSYAGSHYPVEINADGTGFFARGVVSGGQLKASGTYTIPTAERPALRIFYYYDSGGGGGDGA